MYFNLRFRISVFYGLHSYSVIFKNILSSWSFLFFPSSSFFFLISHLSFFLSLLSSFFFFSQFAPVPQFGLPFPKSAAPALPHFLLPCSDVSEIQKKKKKKPAQMWFLFNMSSTDADDATINFRAEIAISKRPQSSLDPPPLQTPPNPPHITTAY